MNGWILILLLNGTTSQVILGFSTEANCRLAGAVIATDMALHVPGQAILSVVTTHYTCTSVK